MTLTLDNGVRKTLASQIDRLDSILDGLAENLNEAVADSVKGAVTVAVQEAVHAALVEILSNAEVRRRLSVQPPVLVRLAEKARSCRSWLAGTAKAVWSKVVATATAAATRCRRRSARWSPRRVRSSARRLSKLSAALEPAGC